MKSQFLVVALTVVLLAFAGPWSAAPQSQSPAINFAQQLSDAYAEITGRLEASVVSIDVVERLGPGRGGRGFRGGRGGPRELQGVGSGFIVDPAGYVLTNNHVIEDADEIAIRLSDGTSLDATVVGTDPETDLAVLRVQAGIDLPAVTLGDSDAARPGHLVLALGSPFGFENSVSAGIVSAQNRSFEGDDALFQRFIQTDAAIHPGNSGGPLVNMAGEVIGVNSAIVTSGGRSSSGLGFALPSNMAADVYRQLVATGRVVRGAIGATLGDAATGGVEVGSVAPNGPASRAGLRAGDVITGWAGEEITQTDALIDLIAMQTVGTRVEVSFTRGASAMSAQVEIADRSELYPAEEEPQPSGRRLPSR